MKAGDLIRTPRGLMLILWGRDKPNVAIYPSFDGTAFCKVAVKK